MVGPDKQARTEDQEYLEMGEWGIMTAAAERSSQVNVRFQQVYTRRGGPDLAEETG